MTPYYSDPWLTVYQGDCREVMASMEPASVHCVVTSPPYWGLRNYGTATWIGGDAGCDHLRPVQPRNERPKGEFHGGSDDGDYAREPQWKDRCRKCGAIREDSQLGLEPTPEEYVANMVAVFREVRRVLRDDGTVWLNLGDSYASGAAGNKTPSGISQATPKRAGRLDEYNSVTRDWAAFGLKPKDLVGIPWRVAFALQQPYYAGQIPDERDRTWLAALVDGEGTFTILSTTSSSAGGVSYPPIAQVRMTSAAVVGKAASLVGVASPAQYPPSAGGNRAVYQWRLSGGRAASIARELYPYLLEKRRQAMVAWNHQQVREGYVTKRGLGMPDEARAKQQVCRDLIRRLNRGEHVDLPSWMVEPPSLTEPGWYLRSDVIWSKPNPMPESVTDRPTKAHEYVFLLSKSARYWFDAEAVREPPAESVIQRAAYMNGGTKLASNTDRNDGDKGQRTSFADYLAGRNIRSVWSIATRPYPGAHFATFPEKLVEPCIKAGCPHRVCSECGRPFKRITEREFKPTQDPAHPKGGGRKGLDESNGWSDVPRGVVEVRTIGWVHSCGHTQSMEPVPGTVLDPFAGSGTTGRVAQRLSRRAVLIDLNGEYLVQAMERNRDLPLGLESA